MLVAIYRASGIKLILKWVDNFFVIRLPHEIWSEAEFTRLSAQFGVPWSLKKQHNFASCQCYLGFDWDLEAKTVGFLEDKLQRLRELLKAWLVEGAWFGMAEAARLHGKLVHASLIFPLICPFTCLVSFFAASFLWPGTRLHAPSSLAVDLTWIRYLIELMPNALPLSVHTPADIGWWGNASTSFGIGIVVGGFWGVWQWADGFRVGIKEQHNIGWAEAVAIELGLAMAHHHTLLDTRPVGSSRILVRSDNEGVVAVVNKGRSRSCETNLVLKQVFATLARVRISLATIYVPSANNVADELSRGDVHGFLAHFPAARTQSLLALPSHLATYLQSW
ncbi:hypothetical protein EVJ58_g8844 [Rhodofomes roseus]|uniref:Uncharacterized protein n=1 Tax=Rhodofomes roseus TaxID=34475 RepID=A0A4Y9XXS7_9APHY|nr:hypothetical protein EVJ58_g8844 [Rhodofomes roseus]